MTKIAFNIFSSIFCPTPPEVDEIEENQAPFRVRGRTDFIIFYVNKIFIMYLPEKYFFEFSVTPFQNSTS